MATDSVLEPTRQPLTAYQLHKAKLRWNERSTTPDTGYTAAERVEITRLVKAMTPDIERRVRAFARRYGGHYDDLLADAWGYFLREYDQYHPSCGRPFVEVVGLRVWYSMLDKVRTETIRNTQHPTVRGDVVYLMAGREDAGEYDPAPLKDSLTADGRRVVHLTLYGKEVAEEAAAKGGSPSNVAAAVKRYLREFGWSAERITTAFAEVAEVLDMMRAPRGKQCDK